MDNAQNDNGQAKPYQDTQFLTIIETYNLRIEGEKMCDYHMNVFYTADDGGYIADIPLLKYCSAFGKTREIAVKEVLIAYDAWMDAAKETRRAIPLPSLHQAERKIA